MTDHPTPSAEALAPQTPGIRADYPPPPRPAISARDRRDIRASSERAGFINGHWFDRADIDNLTALLLLARLDRTERAFLDASRFIPTDQTIELNADTNRLAVELMEQKRHG